ncbi:DUF4856 domain-containing protein [uncultured Flavobacterium sp.]|uniref:DUF4856 domain-containing protein n=1 Tax=uncultured Flavobacterium sp. TaxID=165435 RepID=UPI0030CA4A28
MNTKKQILALVAFSSLFISCTKNDIDIVPQNYTIPDTYTFDRNSTTSVDYSGQSSRISMLQEMGDYYKTQATAGNEVNETVLNNMYSNSGNPFSSTDLNTSGKQLKDKTAASTDYFTLLYGGGSTVEQASVRTFFQTQFTQGNNASLGNNAAVGVAGKYLDGTSTRLFAANGLEPQQVVLKGMMGASFMDQIANNYLSVNKLDAGTNVIDNTNKVVEAGKNYTTMEHNWDEAYGYIYGGDIASTNSFKFWSSYINQVNNDTDFNTLKAAIDLAFRKGRAAIVANDYTTRDAQIAIIKEKLALVPAVRAVFYLQEGKAKLITDNGAKAFHALSEGYGFIMSLRYTNKPGTNNPYFTKTEVDTMLNSLISGPNGLWDIDNISPKLDAISAQIATKFGFTVAQAATVN